MAAARALDHLEMFPHTEDSVELAIPALDMFTDQNYTSIGHR